MRSIALAALALGALSVGGHGRLDPSFGSDRDGQVVMPVGDGGGAYAIALQRDGKLVVAGFGGYYGSGSDFEVARYSRHGEFDGTFSQDGEVMTDFGTGMDQAYGVKVQRDGKIVAAGYTYAAAESPAAHVAVARYRPNGSLDPSFGTSGKVLEPGYGLAMALQRDGKLVIGGQDASGNNFALYRLKPDGSLDAGFGTNGEVTTSFALSRAEVHDLAIQPDGKIVAVGRVVHGSNVSGALARYNLDGSLDTTFGSGGKVTGLRDSLEAVVLQGSRRILVAAGVELIGLRRNGSLDRTFGRAHGMTVTPVGINALALQRDGKIVVAGAGEVQNADFALARFDRDGLPDPTFHVTTEMSEGEDVAYGLVIQRDGKPVAAGVADENGWSGGMIGLARYLAPNPCTVPNVKRLPTAAAKLKLRLAHCALGRVTHVFSTTVRKGRVISQHPAAGAVRPEGTRVRLVVSR